MLFRSARTRGLRREASLVGSCVALELGGLGENVEAGDESRSRARDEAFTKLARHFFQGGVISRKD